MPASYRFSAIMILARSMATSRALCAGRALVLSCGGEFEAGCCAFSRELSGLIEKLRATHVRSFKFIAKPPDATAFSGLDPVFPDLASRRPSCFPQRYQICA